MSTKISSFLTAIQAQVSKMPSLKIAPALTGVAKQETQLIAMVPIQV
jgi:hypothetical protein